MSRGEQKYLSSDLLNAGDWVHATMMVNQGLGQAILYIDGVRQDSVELLPFQSVGGRRLRLGATMVEGFEAGERYRGFVDDLVFSHRTYTDAGVAALASASAQAAPYQANRDADGDEVRDTLDRFPLDATEQIDHDNDGTGDVADSDDDNDGIPDSIEFALGLDPRDAADAADDLDSDGISNLSEYLSGTRVDEDDVHPWLAAPSDLTLAATGPLTAVELGVAQAEDARDGRLIPVPSQAGPFASGRHNVQWRVSDLSGNEAEATQTLTILPQVFITTPDVVG